MHEKSRKRRGRQHLNSDTDNTKMVVLEACVIRRKAELGGQQWSTLRSYLATVPGRREEISGEVTEPKQYANKNGTET